MTVEIIPWYTMVNLHESYEAQLGFELSTPGSAVRRATHYENMPIQIYWKSYHHQKKKKKKKMKILR